MVCVKKCMVHVEICVPQLRSKLSSSRADDAERAERETDRERAKNFIYTMSSAEVEVMCVEVGVSYVGAALCARFMLCGYAEFAQSCRRSADFCSCACRIRG